MLEDYPFPVGDMNGLRLLRLPLSQMEAIDVDTKALMIQPDGELGKGSKDKLWGKQRRRRI